MHTHTRTHIWLHYDTFHDAAFCHLYMKAEKEGKNVAFCHLCIKAEKEGKLLAGTKREPSFISKGFTNWKKAHKGFKCHKEAIEALCLLPTQIVGHVDDLRSQEVKDPQEIMFLKLLITQSYVTRVD